MTIDRFKEWMASSTPAEKKELAKRAATSLGTLYQLDYGERGNGKPFKASADLAGRIEQGVKWINRRKRHPPLPEVLRGDLCETCSKCRFYKKECGS